MKNYVSKIAKENGMTERAYLCEASKSYVVIENGKAWSYCDGSPIVYDDKAKVEEDIKERKAECEGVMNFKIMTELDYIKSLAA